MQEGFLKFKKKSNAHIAIKCSVFALAGAMTLIGVILLACKLAKVNMLFSLIGLIGLSAGGVAYAILRTPDMKLARRLDGVFGFGEKVQTMLAFSSQSGTIIEIQREDTNKRLSSASTKSLRFEKMWLYILIGVIALALFVTAVALPTSSVAAKEPEHIVTEWENSALDQLIDYVRDSKATQSLKASAVDELVSLKNLLGQGIAEKDLGNFVTQTIQSIRSNVFSTNSQAGLSANQKKINSDLGEYIADKLCEMFDIEKPQNDVDPGGEGGGNSNPEPTGPETGSGGTGEFTVAADELFYDPVHGYIAYGDALAEYNSEMMRAFREGVLSEEEWYNFLHDYFDYLAGIQAKEG